MLRPQKIGIEEKQGRDMTGSEMKIAGPNGFERSYTLEGSAGQHEPEVIRVIVGKMVPASSVC